ncbi:hypothetical protein [Parvularcula sp. IMCC14364]|uniref:hypothetical protein n=1 Tax=Parvularcula sp. IMCC14364 TaxID=3067902 RepID=UPI002740AFE2|nr:hypothetical protein [Parvularcula sp. IMCC14364]
MICQNPSDEDHSLSITWLIVVDYNISGDGNPIPASAAREEQPVTWRELDSKKAGRDRPRIHGCDIGISFFFGLSDADHDERGHCQHG